MKNFFFYLLFLMIWGACGNKTEPSTTEETPKPANVENVNGNIPDTTNSVTLNNPMPVDSSKLKDSLDR